jgi:hypothetical protein
MIGNRYLIFLTNRLRADKKVDQGYFLNLALQTTGYQDLKKYDSSGKKITVETLVTIKRV